MSFEQWYLITFDDCCLGVCIVFTSYGQGGSYSTSSLYLRETQDIVHMYPFRARPVLSIPMICSIEQIRKGPHCFILINWTLGRIGI